MLYRICLILSIILNFEILLNIFLVTMSLSVFAKYGQFLYLIIAGCMIPKHKRTFQALTERKKV